MHALQRVCSRAPPLQHIGHMATLGNDACKHVRAGEEPLLSGQKYMKAELPTILVPHCLTLAGYRSRSLFVRVREPLWELGWLVSLPTHVGLVSGHPRRSAMVVGPCPSQARQDHRSICGSLAASQAHHQDAHEGSRRESLRLAPLAKGADEGNLYTSCRTPFSVRGAS